MKNSIKLIAMGISILSCLIHYTFAKNSNVAIQQLLKEQSNMDFKIISNTSTPLNGATFVVVESPNGERFALLASQDGSFIIPLANGIIKDESKSELKTALNNVNQYNKEMIDKKVLALFKQYDNLVLKIPASISSKNTIYMVLDTTCPFCLREIMHLDDYLKNNNIHILIIGILGQKSIYRVAGYYKEFPNAKTREQKIALIKKVFEKNYNPKEINEKTAKEITEAAISVGIQAVPYLMEK